MSGYSCWFCGKTIDGADAGAVMIGVENLWRWADGRRGEEDPWQGVYAHSTCAKDRMAGATRTLEPHIFGKGD
jgi:hypothetical protein